MTGIAPLSRFARLAAVLACLSTAAAAAPVTPGTTEFAYGYFCALEPVGEGVAENTISGTVSFVAGRPVFLRTGSLVPAQLGIGFGVHVRVQPQFSGPVSVSVEHPPMGPNGVTSQGWTTELSAEELQYLGYTFDVDYEMVQGGWTMSATANGRLIYEVSFNVVDAAVLPAVECGNTPIS